MLNMKEKVFIGCAILLAVVIVVSLLMPANYNQRVFLTTIPEGNTVSVPAGKSFDITCRGLGGNSEKFSDMQWLNEEGDIMPKGIPGVQNEKEKNSLKLEFINPQKEDSGKYECSAFYDNEHLLQTEVAINFHVSGDLPTFEINYENIIVEEGSQIKMKCSAAGEKPITYKWYENEGQYDNNSQIRIQEIEDQASIYIIEIVTKNHEGLYTCTAQNTHGLSSKTFELEVVPSSKNNSNDDTPYISKAGVENVGTTSVVFSIEIIGSAESIEVQYNESRENKARMTQWNYGDRYEIKDLIPGGSYVFRFRIVHSVVGKWSREYQVILLPDTPEVIFYNLENGNFKIGWNRKFDDIMRGTIDKYELTYLSVQIEGGNRWVPSKCPITVHIPSCATSSYTISGLSKNVYYEIQLRAHTAAGYGEPFKQKIFFSSY